MKQCPECKRAYDDANSFCVFDGKQLALSEETDPCIGLIIDGKYRIDSKIAKGGTGTVYEATHLQLNAKVAIKIIHPHLASDPRALERFRREALITMRVRHTNAIAVMDFGMTTMKMRNLSSTGNGSPMVDTGGDASSVYVVMELLDGVTLDHRLRERGFLTPQEANPIMQQICAALHVAHEHQIVHRDLKPENVFFHKDEEREVIKLVDFGIAKYKGKVENEDEEMRLTQAGFVVGTPFYMSPEQCGGFEVDHRSDIYSLGVILYQMLTGKMPFEGAKASIIVMKHITEKAKPIYEIRPEIPAVINAVVMHALEKKPEDRPQSVLELAQELDSAVKAITDSELQKVFLDASDSDLEAALLLATDPGSNAAMLAESSVSRRSTGNLEHVDTAESNSRYPTPDMVALSESQITAINNSPPADELFMELQTISKDIAMLLTIVSNDLECKITPDFMSFGELRAAVDNLRGLLFAIYKTHYSN